MAIFLAPGSCGRRAREAHELDIERARRMTPDERLAEGVDLVRIAAKLQAGRPTKSSDGGA